MTERNEMDERISRMKRTHREEAQNRAIEREIAQVLNAPSHQVIAECIAIRVLLTESSFMLNFPTGFAERKHLKEAFWSLGEKIDLWRRAVQPETGVSRRNPCKENPKEVIIVPFVHDNDMKRIKDGLRNKGWEIEKWEWKQEGNTLKITVNRAAKSIAKDIEKIRKVGDDPYTPWRTTENPPCPNCTDTVLEKVGRSNPDGHDVFTCPNCGKSYKENPKKNTSECEYCEGHGRMMGPTGKWEGEECPYCAEKDYDAAMEWWRNATDDVKDPIIMEAWKVAGDEE